MNGKTVTHSTRPDGGCVVPPLVPLVGSMKIITEQMWPTVVVPVQKHVSSRMWRACTPGMEYI